MQREISLAALCHSDAAALAEFAEATYADLYRWFHWLTGDTHQAADLTQATFAGFWSTLEEAGKSKARNNAQARVWLFGIGRNIWRKRCRAKKNSNQQALVKRQLEQHANNGHAQLASRNSGEDGVERLIAAEDSQAVRQAVACLPEEQREAITLRYWQDMSYADIAHVLSTTESNARQRVHQARTRLRSQLKFLQPDQESSGANR